MTEKEIEGRAWNYYKEREKADIDGYGLDWWDEIIQAYKEGANCANHIVKSYANSNAISSLLCKINGLEDSELSEELAAQGLGDYNELVYQIIKVLKYIVDN